MTSYTKKLYHRDPGAALAAEDFARQRRLYPDSVQQSVSLPPPALCYGKQTDLPQFHSSRALHKRAFGTRRVELNTEHLSKAFACSQNCGHPACTQGCTLLGRR